MDPDDDDPALSHPFPGHMQEASDSAADPVRRRVKRTGTGSAASAPDVRRSTSISSTHSQYDADSLSSTHSSLLEDVSEVTSTDDESDDSEEENYLQELASLQAELEAVEAGHEVEEERTFERATAGWFEYERQKHAFLVLIFYRGSW